MNYQSIVPINRKIIFVLQDNVDFVFRQIKFEEKEGEFQGRISSGRFQGLHVLLLIVLRKPYLEWFRRVQLLPMPLSNEFYFALPLHFSQPPSIPTNEYFRS